ncbi:hypothetical protein NI17_015340 [Thermobifida halotolerans]|uniref:Uncharacterized protein n=1 Tax=Thermobifida halotolerans TaxID=483545 RepID=A0A399G8M3_9ACTN|nr:hypothetical protein NI17_015340 [Thermobifida halotolerans]
MCCVSSLRGFEPAPDRLPHDLRVRLVELDRLREVWTGHQRRRPSHQWSGNRARLLRRHILELRTLAGHPPAASEAAERLVNDGFDSGGFLSPEERERLHAEERALASLTEASRTGREMTPAYLDDIVHSLTGRSVPGLGDRLTGCLAEATAVWTHPVIRAALVYLCAEQALLAAEGAAPLPPGTGPLPWAMASLVLMRANHPPLIADHRPVSVRLPRQRAPLPQDRLVALVRLFAELQIAVMRGELSWTAVDDGESGEHCQTLARATYRRLLEHLRQRAPALSMVLRELDPDSRVRVTFGDPADAGGHRARMDLAADRALLARGGPSWWVCLEADCTDTTLRLLLSVQEVGTPATGVLAVTADALVDSPGGSEDALDLAPTDCVTLLSTDSVDERWPEVAALADETVSRAVDRLTSVMA